MAKVSRDMAEVNARILYWGLDGSGKSENLRAAFTKLRPDHRGELREVPSRLDPTVFYEVLPISLGEVAGIKTQLEMIAVPGGAEQAPTRKQLLDQVDGVVFVVDASSGRLEDNVASFEELREALAAYGRDLEQLPLVLQYNKRDLTDSLALEDVHRKLEAGGAPFFEAVATQGTGVLQTLSTISKRVIRALREESLGGAPAAAAAAPPAAPVESPVERMERAILDEPGRPEDSSFEAAAGSAETLLDRPFAEVAGEISRPPGVQLGSDLSIVSVGKATRADERSVRVPLVLGDATGGTSTLVLTIQLDALIDESG